MSRVFDVPWQISDALVVYLAAWVGLPFLVAATLGLVAPLLPPASTLVHGLIRGDIKAAFTFVILDGLAAAGLVYYFARKYRFSWDSLGFRPFNLLKGSLYILGAGMFFLVFSNLLLSLISIIFHGFNASQPQINEFTLGANRSPSISLLALVIIPPFIEETVFRGFIFPAFADRFGLVLGIVGSSALFAVAHLQLNVAIYTFVLGCLLAMMYWKTKSIWPGIILHMLNNYLAFTVILSK